MSRIVKQLMAATLIVAASAGIAGAQTAPRDADKQAPDCKAMRSGQMGPQMMQQMMRRMMMQRMMMAPGANRMRMQIGPGMTGRRMTDRKLDASEVKRILDGRLAWQGNKRLKVGKVTEKDENAIIAEIQTVDGSLVAKFSVNRKTGAMRYAE